MKGSVKTKIPNHLKSYVVEQNYESYTPRDHALWRFIMLNAKEFLAENAHSSFLNGLEMTGIPTDHIPRISEMNEKLSQFGWAAVCVRGFIPPLAFLEFQSNHILPIAADMRSVDHFDYTPAPDIVHEATGHAPILADKDYREYLLKYAHVARRSIFSREDVELYEAIRLLSDVKENPDSTDQMIHSAEEKLKKAQDSVTWVSEAAKVGRMYWWTVEYGLIGSVNKPKLYGAGLLSSIGEGRDCLEPKVKKLPFSMECISTSYDITEPQPQLFVTKDFVQLTRALEELESTLAFKKGGEEGLKIAKKSEALTTTQLNSGLEISGILKDYMMVKGQAAFALWSGPMQLCFEAHQLENQGRERHPDGFSSPLGMWVGTKKAPGLLTDKELADIGLKKGSRCELNYVSGFKVVGVLEGWTRSSKGDLLILSWTDCTVTYGSKTYYEPSWGEFDLAVGDSIRAVSGGPADWLNYGEGNFGRSSSTPGRATPYSESEKKLFSLYDRVRSIRSDLKKVSKDEVIGQLREISDLINKEYPQEWLLALELGELLNGVGLKVSELPWFQNVKKKALNLSQYPESQSRFIKMGMERVKLSA